MRSKNLKAEKSLRRDLGPDRVTGKTTQKKKLREREMPAVGASASSNLLTPVPVLTRPALHRSYAVFLLMPGAERFFFDGVNHRHRANYSRLCMGVSP